MTDARDKSALPLIRKLQAVFSHNLFAELEYVQQENRILRSKFGHRVPLTDADRSILVRYGMRIKHRLDDPGDRFLHRRGMDIEWFSHVLCAVLYPSRYETGKDPWLYAASEWRMDISTGPKFLHDCG